MNGRRLHAFRSLTDANVAKSTFVKKGAHMRPVASPCTVLASRKQHRSTYFVWSPKALRRVATHLEKVRRADAA